jgi:Cft2 family RNA processing exonuclease
MVEENKYVKVMLFDSNHMAGSVMILMQVQGKYYFHTGDMRFHHKMGSLYTELF